MPCQPKARFFVPRRRLTQKARFIGNIGLRLTLDRYPKERRRRRPASTEGSLGAIRLRPLTNGCGLQSKPSPMQRRSWRSASAGCLVECTGRCKSSGASRHACPTRSAKCLSMVAAVWPLVYWAVVVGLMIAGPTQAFRTYNRRALFRGSKQPKSESKSGVACSASNRPDKATGKAGAYLGRRNIHNTTRYTTLGVRAGTDSPGRQGRTQRAKAAPGLFAQDAVSVSPFLLIERAGY